LKLTPIYNALLSNRSPLLAVHHFKLGKLEWFLHDVKEAQDLIAQEELKVNSCNKKEIIEQAIFNIQKAQTILIPLYRGNRAVMLDNISNELSEIYGTS